MHATTRAVREMYEQFPYPAGPVTLRLGFDVRRSLSFVGASRPAGRPLHVLDAGCGRGAGLLGMAIAQPGVRFHGVDLNRVALEEVRRSARARGLSNVTTAEVDLETLDGLDVPEDGYDVIISSGVVHHLVDAAAGLSRLREALAPWGVLDLMVYARPGRVGIERVAAFLEEHLEAGPLPERLAAARRLCAARAATEPAFADALRQDDVEFVDRYLHPCFESYDLDGYRQLVAQGGLELVAWTDPSAVLPASPSQDLWEAAAQCTPRTRPRMWDALLTHAGVPRRPVLTHGAVDTTAFALNPEGTLDTGVRTLWTGPRNTPVTWRHPRRDPVPLAEGPAAAAADFLVSVGRPFRGLELVQHCVRRGIAADEARKLCRLLEHLGMLWRPHEVELDERA